ncbi:hypothetical protein K438DRAFT_1765486 [Mycena galopus ATCC 62051]|nr:hypothetical protein K438DRAFT_1765486 [Mycena galopus ATCC 62051]
MNKTRVNNTSGIKHRFRDSASAILAPNLVFTLRQPRSVLASVRSLSRHPNLGASHHRGSDHRRNPLYTCEGDVNTLWQSNHSRAGPEIQDDPSRISKSRPASTCTRRASQEICHQAPPPPNELIQATLAPSDLIKVFAGTLSPADAVPATISAPLRHPRLCPRYDCSRRRACAGELGEWEAHFEEQDGIECGWIVIHTSASGEDTRVRGREHLNKAIGMKAGADHPHSSRCCVSVGPEDIGKLQCGCTSFKIEETSVGAADCQGSQLGSGGKKKSKTMREKPSSTRGSAGVSFGRGGYLRSIWDNSKCNAGRLQAPKFKCKSLMKNRSGSLRCW